MASAPNDRSRVVAARIAFWFVVEAKRMAKAGNTAQEIIERSMIGGTFLRIGERTRLITR